ncbi:hypothetical protein [Streptomyces sp. NPDC058045]|uniref:hypothetical protein n=1 Tax=Streptomyces sp. NPDC058045 TaxID=3346311 RepID=UPI0036EC4BD1
MTATRPPRVLRDDAVLADGERAAVVDPERLRLDLDVRRDFGAGRMTAPHLEGGQWTARARQLETPRRLGTALRRHGSPAGSRQIG